MNCQYCDKNCINDNSLRNHERLCKSNPNRQVLKSNFIQYNEMRKELGLGGSNQFTKARNEGKTITVSEETRKKLSNASKGKRHSEESRKKISETMQRVVKERPESYSAANVNGRSKKIQYKDVLLDSTWEYEFVKWCDDKHIKWERNKRSFDYDWNGKRSYYPDFYLEDYDIYVEVKGYERERDRAKWSSVPNLLVIKIKELQKIREGIFQI
jgi:hypothetical protein